MKDIIQQIMNQENLDEIYGYAQNALFKDGPVSITTLEILSYLKLFAPDYFSAVEEEILSIMGIFYKKPTARTLQSKLFELYSEHIRQTYHHDYTPVQANILKQIQANQHFSFSAPTSTGKSHVFRHLIETSKRDVAIIVPSRALINEYYIVFETNHLSQYGIIATNTGNGTKSPQTGDNSNLALWFAVLFISGGVLTVFSIASKKKRVGINK